jgi:hypothetical protein
MEILNDRIGILLKHGKVMGSLTKRYFFIDNHGNLYYTDKESVIQELLKHTSYDNDKFTHLVSNEEKKINLNDCSVSSIKTYLESTKADLQGRSYFELYVKERDYRSLLLFGWNEENTKLLHEYVNSFREINTIEEKELHNFGECDDEENIHNKVNTEMLNDLNFLKTNNEHFDNINIDSEMKDKDDNCNITTTGNHTHSNIFENARDKNQMAKVLSKLEGKFVNQNGWEKECIKIVNPTSELTEYEEVWVELENSSNYSGPVKNGMPHGFGKEYRPDGSLYTGYFNQGKWHGSGTITTETLDTYQGEFIDGCICGI